MINLLIKLSENDKRVLIALCMLFLIIIVIVGYISLLVKKIMIRQGKQVDKMMYDIMKARVITDAKTFRKVSFLKSHRFFFKKAWVPFIAICVSVLTILIYGWATNDPGLKYYAKGFNDLSIKLYWPTQKFFGINLICDWPKLIEGPDFSWNLGKYIALVMTLVGSVFTFMFLIQVQALIARAFRIRKLRITYFSKDLNKLAEHQV